MRKLQLIIAALSVAALVSGCKRKPSEPARPAGPVKRAAPPGALPADTDHASGTVQAVVLDLRTRVDIPDLEPEGKVPDRVRKAQADSVLKQIMMITDSRGTAIFNTDDFYIPKNTELRYNPSQRRYVLCDPTKKTYWAMTGSEIGNLLEGGPAMTRSAYTIAINDTQEKETIAGVDAVRSDAEIGFNWTVRTKSGSKDGKVKVKLAIWHSANEKLKPAWGKMMVDFLTVPFQDAQGQKVVDQLKDRVGFPVKWVMEVIDEAASRDKRATYPKLVTVAQTLQVKEIDRAGLASPPVGYRPAVGPYEFGDGGQMISEELLSQIPSRPRKPHQDDSERRE